MWSLIDTLFTMRRLCLHQGYYMCIIFNRQIFFNNDRDRISGRCFQKGTKKIVTP